MGSDLVSVIIPTYNRPSMLSRAIDSVLNQTYTNIEVLVVDDNHTDTVEREETEQIMTKYKNNPKVKYIQHEYNKNGSAARNTGFKHSKGEYIAILDDDDEFLQGKIEVQVNCLENRNNSWGACYTKYKHLYNGKLATIYSEKHERNPYFDGLCRNLFVQAGSNLMIRRSVYNELGGFDESFRRNQDIEFTVRLLKRYRLAYVDELGLVHHKHFGERSSYDMYEVTEQYISTFKNDIEALNERDRNIFYRMINLQLFRDATISDRNMTYGYKMIKNKDVRIRDVIRYFSHLAYRKIFRLSYGFKIN